MQIKSERVKPNKKLCYQIKSLDSGVRTVENYKIRKLTAVLFIFLARAIYLAVTAPLARNAFPTVVAVELSIATRPS